MKIRDGVFSVWSLPDQSDVPVTHFVASYCPRCGGSVRQRMNPYKDTTRLYEIAGKSMPLVAREHRCARQPAGGWPL